MGTERNKPDAGDFFLMGTRGLGIRNSSSHPRDSISIHKKLRAIQVEEIERETKFPFDEWE